jgi:hypothetical protein
MIEDLRYLFKYYKIRNNLQFDDAGEICLWNGSCWLCIFDPNYPQYNSCDNKTSEYESLLTQFYDLLEGNFYITHGNKPIKIKFYK